MEPVILIGLLLLAVPLVPIVLSIRTFVRVGRIERSIRELEARVDRLSSAAAVQNLHEVPGAREALPPEGGSHEDMDRGRPEDIGSGSREMGAAPGVAAAAPILTGGFRLQAEDRTPVHHPEEPESLETAIGTRWLLYVGVVAIVIGIAYFEKLAIEKGWIGEHARVIQGAVVGLALIATGARFVLAGYALYGQMMSGCGAAILFVSTYAAFNYYHLIDRPLAFVLMIAITALTAALADRQQSQGLAVLAVGGGFATPFLLPGTTDAQVALFGYDAILVAGTMVLAHRRDWPLLNIVSYIFTMVTIAGWAGRFYTPAKYLSTELFLTLFCAMFLYILHECRRRPNPGAHQLAALFLWTAPVAYYFASLIVLAYQQSALLIWLVSLGLAGGVASVAIGSLAGLVIWLAATLPLLLWSTQQHAAEWLAPGLAATAGIYAIALAAQLRAMLEREDFSPVLVAWLHLTAMLMFAGAYFLLEPIRYAATAPVGAGFALWNGAIAAGLAARRRTYARHFLALAFTLLSIAIALQFDGAAVTVGWAAEGAAIVALGLHERRNWLRLGGVALFAIAIARTIEMLTSVAPINQAVFLNTRAGSAAFVMALSYLIAWLHHRDREAPDRSAAIGVSVVAAQLLGVALLTSEINSYWRERNDHLAQEAMISVTWALYSTVLIVVGLWRRYAPIRYFAMALFALTTAKVFFVDLAELERIYRVMSVIGLGILLLITSWLYQRSRNEAALQTGIDDLNGRI